MIPSAPRHLAMNQGADLTGFRRAVRVLLLCDVPPEKVTWSITSAPEGFGSQAPAPFGMAGKPIILPRRLATMIRLVICHRDPEKYALLYEIVWHVTTTQPRPQRVLDDRIAPRLLAMREGVVGDIKRLQSGLGFRQVDNQQGEECFAAWFDPQHYILEESAQFFVERFGSLVWTILTPKGSLHWDRKELLAGPHAAADGLMTEALETGWRGCLASSFNPESVSNPMTKERPPEAYWRNLPENRAVPHLARIALNQLDDLVQNAQLPRDMKLGAAGADSA
jgi:uracil-DNA glycosylase